MSINGASVLLVDDEPFAAPLYKSHLEANHGMVVHVETDARRAKARALEQLFDIVVVDAKIEYRGTLYGGLLLAHELLPRYGAHSIVVTSQYVTSVQLELFGLEMPFIMKPHRGDIAHYVEQIALVAQELLREQFVFAAMGYTPENVRLYEAAIEPALRAQGYRVLIQKDDARGGNIMAQMYTAIRKAKIVILVADGQNANAYLEAGYADALEKEIVVIANGPDDLLFDIRQRNALFHRGDAASLGGLIARRISGIRNP
jgi:CheY-like chemotaxis protein